jgi:hypothetical protein
MLLTGKRKRLGWLLLKGPGQGRPQYETRNSSNDGRSKIMTTELNDVLMFCFFYSGIVLYSLWITVAERHLRVEARARKLR